MKKRILIIICILILAACTQQQAECQQDSDCVKAGCSGTVCTTQEKAINIITTCEIKEEYKCYEDSTCKCIKGKCAWTEQKEISKCLEEFI